MDDSELRSFVEGVKLLCLDAGNTVIFLDHERLAGAATELGFPVKGSRLIETEGEAKLLQEEGRLLEVPWKGRDEPGAVGWGKMVGTILHRAGVRAEQVQAWLPGLWASHMKLNFWSLVPVGFAEAVDGARKRGIKVAIVSNSEGKLDELFVQLGIRSCFDLLLDSGKLHVEKPDPAIFRLALDAFAISPADALHLGDSIATDVLGARAAGLKVALIDPYGHTKGRAEDVPRVKDVAQVAQALGQQAR